MNDIQELIKSLYWYDIISNLLFTVFILVVLAFSVLFFSFMVVDVSFSSREDRENGKKRLKRTFINLFNIFSGVVGIYFFLQCWYWEKLSTLHAYQKSLKLEHKRIKNEKYNEKHKHKYNH